MTDMPYASAEAVESAIRDAAKHAHEADKSRGTSELIRQAHFDRLLCRVFSEGQESDWVLKGGTGLLARVPNARATKDVDLYLRGYSVDEALLDLRRLARIDLGDYFRFEYVSHQATIASDAQPGTDGCRVQFDVYLGSRRHTQLRVDLAVGLTEVGAVETFVPANRMRMPRLVTSEYRVYPVVNQIADKVCATMTTYATGPSSREHDLVDLVVLATTQRVNATELREAVHAEARLRQLKEPEIFLIPVTWGRAYERDAGTTPACERHRSIAAARHLMHDFIDPLLGNEPVIGVWNPMNLNWDS